MFGYLKPDLPYLYLKDDKLYKSLYCGVCKSIGSNCGQMARMTLTYDIAFLSAIAHNIIGTDVEIKNKRCVAHWFKPRPVAMRDDLTDMLACINVILAWHKVMDDVIDKSGGLLKKLAVKKGYRKAKKKFPKIDEIVTASYIELRTMEKQNETSIDKVADSFSCMLESLSRVVLGEFATEQTDKLFYFIGKWIYLIDALDDYDKDIKRKNYNPFYSAYNLPSLKELFATSGRDIAFIFNDIFSNIGLAFKDITFKFNKDLVANILLRGIPAKTEEITKRAVK